MSHAAGMWAAGEHTITHAETALAEAVLARSGVSLDELASFDQEPVDPNVHGHQYAGGIKITVTSGQNTGRQFVVMPTDSGFQRGNRLFPSLAAAAGGYAAKWPRLKSGWSGIGVCQNAIDSGSAGLAN